jgi:hypothetical protein
MAYRRPPTYIRNDLLTPAGYGQLGLNAQALEAAFRAEHIESTGEHNTPLIPRTLGTMYWDGSKYVGIDFNTDVSYATTAANGRLRLGLVANRYSKDSGPLFLQNASATGSTKPCLSWGQWNDDTHVTIYSTYWNGTLGSPGGSWYTLGEDCSFHLGIHTEKILQAAPVSFGAPLLSRQGLRAGSGTTYVNKLVSGTTDLEVALRVEHANGAHDTVKIQKLWAHAQWDGYHYGIVDQQASRSFDGGGIASIDAVSSGIAEVLLDAPLASTNYQVFVDVDYARLTGDEDDYFIACVPFTGTSARSFRIYLYKRYLSGGGVEYFDRASDVDFYIWVGHA